MRLGTGPASTTHVAEPIAQLDIQVIASDGRSYFPNVVAEPNAEWRWEAWLEFVPLDDSESLLTDTETTQASRDDVVRWASTLTETFIDGAFRRAGPISGRIGRAAVAAEITRTSWRLPPRWTRSRSTERGGTHYVPHCCHSPAPNY